MSPLTHFTIYAAILRLSLPLTERLLLCLLLTFDSKGLTTSNQAIGQCLNVSQHTVKNALAELRRRGLIETEKQQSRHRQIRVNEQNLLALLKSQVEPFYLPDTGTLLDCSLGHLLAPLKVNRRKGSKGEEKYARKRTPEKAPVFIPPTVAQVKAYAESRGCPDFDAEKFIEYYAVNDWHDKNGDPVQNWKQKMLSVWLKPKRTPNRGDPDWLPSEKELDEIYAKS